MLAMDVWCFSKSTIRVDLEKHQTRLHYWGNSLCNFEESPLQLWVFLLCTKHPYSNSLFLFCGRRCDRIKALHFEKDGFCLYYKRLDNGRFQWPRDPSEVRNLTRQEYRWLLEGLSIDQPKAIRPAGRKDF